MKFSKPIRVAVLMPSKDDWTSASQLIAQLDAAELGLQVRIDCVIVDDGSVNDRPEPTFTAPFTRVKNIRVVRLRRNLGHQRAIAIGLVYIDRNLTCDAVVVMDSDGEDTPEGVVQLLNSFNGDKAVFAERTRRTESLVFRFFYWIYRCVHLMLTGIAVRVGNFSILPRAYLKTLVVMSELWNHYAAALFRSGLPFTTTPIPRGYRIAGKSRMRFVSLVAHGLSAISVFGDIVGIRTLILSVLGALLSILGILAVVSVRIFTVRAVPGWATYSVGLLAIVCIQFITIASSFTFTMLSNRINLSFVPLRDHDLFIASVEELYANDPA